MKPKIGHFLHNLNAGVALIVVGVCAMGGAAIGYDHRGYYTPANAGLVPAGTAPVAVQPHAAPRPVAVPATTAAPPASTAIPPPASVATGGLPESLTIGSIGVRAPVVSVTAQDGALNVPVNPQTVGWWIQSARPGSPQGSVVIVGHVDSAASGRGALFYLDSAPIGAQATIATSNGVVTYRIVARAVYLKKLLPASVFASAGPARLVLITCGGPFDAATHHYLDNIVDYALPA